MKNSTNLLKRNFYNQNTIKIAQNLLGCYLVREYYGKIIKAEITETEAYRGEYDLASHASRGKTNRTKIMYGAPGHAYIYIIYGMYFMFNVVTEKKDFPAAVLIRSVSTFKRFNGPGKVTKFLHLGKSLNGYDLTKGQKIWLEKPKIKRPFRVIKSPRVGIDYAKHCQKWMWNFKLKES